MIRLTNIKLAIDDGLEVLRNRASERLGIDIEAIDELRIAKKSIDARRGRGVSFIYSVDVEVGADQDALLARLADDGNVSLTPDMAYHMPVVDKARLDKRPVVVGAGPCGLFAALLLSQMGLEPILLERGKSVDKRTKDVGRFWKDGTLDIESNVQFGEGGAGTFSDGKLTTQIKDKANRCKKVLQELVEAGAPEEIMYLSKPHIGTDILVKVVKGLRQKIISLGGQVRFESRVDEIDVDNGSISGVALADGQRIQTNAAVFATGHSGRDVFEMLHNKGAAMTQKPFSIGVRIEHLQSVIDKAQFGKFAGHEKLGPADYKLVHHCTNGRSVYTFCMCPGGKVMAASSEQGGVVTNGMSVYARNSSNANSALLVGVKPEDFDSDHPLAGVEFQRKWERRAFELAGGDYSAPAQLVGDFLQVKVSQDIGKVKPTYRPGVKFCDLSECLPGYVIESLREAIVEFDKKIRGFADSDAVLTGPETRSSSPVRILRGEDFQSQNITGLYPAGEGAGYAGGIISAAVDGVKVAEAVAMQIAGKNV